MLLYLYDRYEYLYSINTTPTSTFGRRSGVVAVTRLARG